VVIVAGEEHLARARALEGAAGQRIFSLAYLFTCMYARMSNSRHEESSEPVPNALPETQPKVRVIQGKHTG
jgi:hypothetical protein